MENLCRIFSYETVGDLGIGEISFNEEKKCFEFTPYLQIKVNYSEKVDRRTKNEYENRLSEMDLPCYEHYEGKTFEEAFEIEKVCFSMLKNKIDFFESKSWVLFRDNKCRSIYLPPDDLGIDKNEFRLSFSKDDNYEFSLRFNEELAETLAQIYKNEFSYEDLIRIFSSRMDLQTIQK